MQSTDRLFANFPLSLTVSVLTHILVILILLGAEFQPNRVPLATIDVELVTEARANRQIVEESAQSDTPQVPPPTNQVAARDSVVVREQIHRGIPDAGRLPPNPRPQAAPKRLSLSLRDVAEKFGDQPPQSERAEKEPRPFSRPMGSGAAFFGAAGSADLLPNLPDGDMTLLNAKAERYAVFVRRVATQVFGALRRSGWYDLTPQDVQAISGYGTVRAVLNREGDLVRVEPDQSSGSPRFDAILQNAVQQAARAPHPPQDAYSDAGELVFIFQSRSWVQVVTHPRSGAAVERRWLMLGTGLE